MHFLTHPLPVIIGTISLFLIGCADSAFVKRDIQKEVISERLELNAEKRFSGDDPQKEIDLLALQNLTAQKAGEIALSHNAQFRADLTTLGIAEADTIEASLLRNPRFDLITAMGQKPFEFLLSLPAESFWQRPYRSAAANSAYQQLAEGLIQNGLDVVRDAKVLHADLNLADDKAKLGSEAVGLLSEISALTDLRLRSGDITELESLAAYAETGTAIEAESRLKNDYKVALERFKNVLGLSPTTTELGLVPNEPDLVEPGELSTLVEKATVNRPDLRSAELGIQTALKKVDWEKSKFLSLFMVLLSMKEIGTHGLLTSPGVLVEVPIFNRNQAQISRAEAEVEQAIQRYFSVKQRVGFEVAESRALLIQALETYTINKEKVIDATRRSKEQALRQYHEGEASYLFVLQQSRALIDAQMRSADLKASVLKTRIQLQRNLGGE